MASINLNFKHIVSHLDDLKHAGYKISKLENEIREQEWKNHQIIKHSAYSAIVYILLSIVVIYTLYKMYRCFRARFVKTKGMLALMIQTAKGANGSGNTVNINIRTSNESLTIEQGDIPLHGSQHSVDEEARTLRPRSTKSYFQGELRYKLDLC
jgi:hypothetical protein